MVFSSALAVESMVAAFGDELDDVCGVVEFDHLDGVAQVHWFEMRRKEEKKKQERRKKNLSAFSMNVMGGGNEA